jgi:choline-sulfatase
MRVLYIDIDSLRQDHLGCYGYGRATSPHIDALARESVRFEGCYISDAPCLPSRTALWSGRCGFHTGVVGHGGTTAQPFIEGPSRGFADRFRETGWMGALRRAGLYTAAISPFGERHSAWHWYAGFNEVHNTGKRGQETAAEINAVALPWLARHAREDNWFLHVNYWDPHTPYRTPADFGEPFADAPLPAWPNEEVRQRGWDGFGPHSPQEPTGFAVAPSKSFRQPTQLDSPEALRRWLDSYDTGIRYADEAVGQLLTALADTGVLDETAIIVSSDHGENQGELNIPRHRMGYTFRSHF